MRRKLQTALALGDRSQQALADEYGVSQQAVSQFASRHRQRIEEIRDHQADEFAGLEIAKKAARLEVYEQLLAACLVPVPKATASGRVVQDPETGATVYEIDAGTAAKVLRSVAEELGHLPTRLSVSGELGVRTNYTITGVSNSDLT